MLGHVEFPGTAGGRPPAVYHNNYDQVVVYKNLIEKVQRFIISSISRSIWLRILHLIRLHSQASDFKCGWMDQVFSAGHALITVLPRCKRWKIVRYYGGAQLHMRLQLWCSTRCLESVSTTALKRLSTSDIRIIYLHKLVSVRHLLITTQAPLTHWSKVR